MSDERPLRRDVFLLVVAGAALGVAYNAMGLASRPARGIPWVAVKSALPSVEDLQPPDSAAAEPAAIPADPEPAAPATARAAPAPPADGTADPPARGTRTADPAPTPTPSAGAPAAGPAATSPGPAAGMPEPRRSAPLPYIPASDQPLQMQLATVKRFFDADAALFLDARDPAEYEKGHIPGAIRLTNPEAQSAPERLQALPVRGRPIIAYCEGGTCEASLELARFLIESGFTKVLVYMGGYPEWAAAGHPVTRGSAP